MLAVNKLLLLTSAVGILLLGGTTAKENAAAKRPPMGWSSWNAFRRHFTEKDIYDQVVLISKSGLKAAGYEYVNIDGAWWNGDYDNGVVYRNETGYFVQPTDKFPGGVPKLSKFIHKKGLKLGWYTSGREEACCCAAEGKAKMKPMSGGREEKDFSLFLEWGVDYLKVDNCGGPRSDKFKNSDDIIGTWSELVGNRDIVLSNSRFDCMSRMSDGSYFGDAFYPENVEQNIPSFCQADSNMFRTSVDIRNNWNSIVRGSLYSLIGRELTSGPGHWNDPDMMQVGNDLTDDENVAHFSLWCVTSAPLIIGTDLRKASQKTINVLKNQHAIRVNQEYDGHPGQRFRVWEKSGKKIEEWGKFLKKKELALVVLNSKFEGNIEYSVDLQYSKYAEHLLGKNVYEKVKNDLQGTLTIDCDVYNIWEGKSVTASDNVLLNIPSHSVSFLIISECKTVTPTQAPTPAPTIDPCPYDCPINSFPKKACTKSFRHCKCNQGFLPKTDDDGVVSCDNCNEVECPENSVAKRRVSCITDIEKHCVCMDLYTKTESGTCVPTKESCFDRIGGKCRDEPNPKQFKSKVVCTLKKHCSEDECLQRCIKDRKCKGIQYNLNAVEKRDPVCELQRSDEVFEEGNKSKDAKCFRRKPCTD